MLPQVQDKRGTLRMALGNTGCLLRLSNQDPGGLLDVHFRLDAHPNCNASRWGPLHSRLCPPLFGIPQVRQATTAYLLSPV